MTENRVEAENKSTNSGTTDKVANNVGRRNFMYYGGWGVISLFIASVLGSTVRFFFPRTLFEPPMMYTIGYLFEYAQGVSERFKQLRRIWVVREMDKLYVIEAKCTHLGCTPNWLAAEGKFKCPCHGSGFTPDGINIEGPAPRPLERFKVTLAEDGEITVDEGTRFRGERREWDKPGAFISV
ncbi:MAG: Rieske (2Fe-2S) protein [Planctomycetes bacterium RIFCSPHIGHO2_02_FULL_40_12]|nr:MAG: Rieske (2Fe-2S) protein [Planctomycetes bacterium RIFCSPHIGHO2_02_FULL_40_12]